MALTFVAGMSLNESASFKRRLRVTLHRVVCCRRTGAGHASVFDWSDLGVTPYAVALMLSPGTALLTRLSKRFCWTFGRWRGGSRVGSIFGTTDEVCERSGDSHRSTSRHAYVRASLRRDPRSWYPNSSPICQRSILERRHRILHCFGRVCLQVVTTRIGSSRSSTTWGSSMGQ